MSESPFLDLVWVAIGVAVVVVAVAIALMEPLLVVALELVVLDHALDSRAALLQALRFTFEGPIDLHVVLMLPLAFDARVEGLPSPSRSRWLSSRLRPSFVSDTAWSRASAFSLGRTLSNERVPLLVEACGR